METPTPVSTPGHPPLCYAFPFLLFMRGGLGVPPSHALLRWELAPALDRAIQQFCAELLSPEDHDILSLALSPQRSRSSFGPGAALTASLDRIFDYLLDSDILDHLLNHPDRWVGGNFLLVLADSRPAAAWPLLSTATLRALEPYLSALLSHPNPVVREEVILHLGRGHSESRSQSRGPAR